MSEQKEFDKKIKNILNSPYVINNFHGVDIKKLNISTSDYKVVNTLREIILNSNINFYQRVKALKFLSRSTYTFTEKYVKECSEYLISDNKVTPDDRYAYLEDKSKCYPLYIGLHEKFFDSILVESPDLPANKHRICKTILEVSKNPEYKNRARDYLDLKRKFDENNLTKEDSSGEDSYRNKINYYKLLYSKLREQLISYKIYVEPKRDFFFYLRHPWLFLKSLFENKKSIKSEFFYGLDLYDDYKNSELSEESYLEIFADVYNDIDYEILVLSGVVI